MSTEALRIGVSHCLLGQRCRYDGGDNRAPALAGLSVAWVPVCPEVELGMSVPREALELVGTLAAPRMIARESRRDYTEEMNRWARARLEALVQSGLDGFVLAARSPSCGLGSVKRFPEAGASFERDGTGLFAQALRERLPDFPVIQDAELALPGALEGFLGRAAAYHRAR